MPLDEDSAALVRRLRDANIPRQETRSPLQARDAMAAARAAAALQPPMVHKVRDIEMHTETGLIEGRLYRPSAEVELPLLVFFHGGGWMLGDLESHDILCRRLAISGSSNVLAVNYRLAPENRFPAAVDDAIASVDWAFEHAADLRVNPARIMVGGDSAGGNLAAVVTLERRNCRKPRLASQILLYPVTDLSCDSASYRIAEPGLPVLGSSMIWFRDHYLAGPVQAQDWRASPLRAPDFSDLPEAYVLTAGYDPLSDEGQAYAEKLSASGTSVLHRHYAGQIHAFLTMGTDFPTTRDAISDIGAFMRGELPS
ncbi:alpha/beta hydrolase [Agrobacterium tumefaciens]|uniref:Alpha/beta hydrolase n=1 Tax=Agrobacterium tumefaciens TaxID=358 RepID=A0AA44F601_AGRTU|nr:alpha/beta hydrolase [Agrobacterium tumefaciens]NSL21305.1 alpha/beta hydrolase [Agrobacterium tumefaciens]NTB83877.1 alpha/beta hydrolase [Agrobacterium tumefaciens]NTC20654.1 alpha/beta hydrolase [Agrobacterium tumefaciens]NTC29348.1 alpha/beta hydrolase [Agrobacterium tumefaciens]NTC57844.1 alpha/beta hydrolase [Agrobacterium tumefaciens]